LAKKRRNLMRYSMLLALSALLVASVLSPLAISGHNHKVLMIIKDHSEEAELMLTKEVGVMTNMLEKAGYKVVVATATGQRMTAGAATVKPDLKLDDVNVKDYSGVIVPCMAVGLDVDAPAEEAPKAAAIVKESVALGKPVAAQLASVLILAEAGVLNGKEYAFTSQERAENYSSLKGATFSGNGVVKDGKIVTSGVCPVSAKNRGLKDGTPELTKAFISELSGEQ
jgi:putative intracellular protease/amidase